MPETMRSQSDISLLYVEDDAATRLQVTRALNARGFHVTVAEDGEQGLALFRDKPHDIVLTDIMMPRINGLDMARAIRTIAPECQIACMTAFSDTAYLIEAIEIGIDQYVLKPIEFIHLYSALNRCREVVELRRDQKRLEAENLNAKKMEAIGILAGGMAHDFNNLLQVILGYVSLARMSAEPGSKTEALLTIVEQSSEKARELSSKLLTLAKGGSASMKPTSLKPLVQDTVCTELRSFPFVKAVIEFPENLPMAALDVDQMKLVVKNLTINAAEAMPDGGALRVTASVVNLPIANCFGLQADEYLHIIFKDSGAGIAPEHLSQIFDPYFSTKEMCCQKGTGLGLALCHSIIKHHNGHIHAESEPDKGTEIHIHLPVSK